MKNFPQHLRDGLEQLTGLGTSCANVYSLEVVAPFRGAVFKRLKFVAELTFLRTKVEAKHRQNHVHLCCSNRYEKDDLLHMSFYIVLLANSFLGIL